LLRVILKYGITRIVAASESALAWLWQQPGPVQPLVRPAVPAEQRPLLLDKAQLLSAASRWGVPVPESLPFLSEGACDLAGEHLGFPLVLKTARGEAGEGVAVSRTPTEMHAAYRRLAGNGHGAVSAQQFCAGSTYLVGLVAVDGEPTSVYVGRQTIQAPRLTGPAIEIESVYEPALVAFASRIAQQLRWTGIGACDFVLDESGVFRFIEFNPRAWDSVWGAVRAGWDALADYATVLTGGRPRPCTPKVGVRTRVFPTYVGAGGEVGLSLPARLLAMRDAPWRHRGLVTRELASFAAGRLGRARVPSTAWPIQPRKPNTSTRPSRPSKLSSTSS
jgi:hypothetical protein